MRGLPQRVWSMWLFLFHHSALCRRVHKRVRVISLSGIGVSLLLMSLPVHAAFGYGDVPWATAQIQALERTFACRIGVALRDDAGRILFAHNGHVRFALNSTVKALACARVWDEQAGQRCGPVALGGQNLYAPEFGALAPDTRVSLDEACRAAMAVSDNRAANCIFALTGGPEALTAWLRELGDNTTSVDDIEPAINQWHWGETRNASTPEAITATWLAIDRRLAEPARAQWHAALASNKTADQLLRAVLPEVYGVGDRTGAGQGTRAIHARIETASGNILYLAVHLHTAPDCSLAARDDLLRSVLRILFPPADESERQ